MSEPVRLATVPGLVALGVGSMVGAGIFALMGETAALTGSAVWLAFGVAGIIALLTGHSFVQLGTRYPTRGGVVESSPAPMARAASRAAARSSSTSRS